MQSSQCMADFINYKMKSIFYGLTAALVILDSRCRGKDIFFPLFQMKLLVGTYIHTHGVATSSHFDFSLTLA